MCVASLVNMHDVCQALVIPFADPTAAVELTLSEIIGEMKQNVWYNS